MVESKINNVDILWYAILVYSIQAYINFIIIYYIISWHYTIIACRPI